MCSFRNTFTKRDGIMGIFFSYFTWVSVSGILRHHGSSAEVNFASVPELQEVFHNFQNDGPDFH